MLQPGSVTQILHQIQENDADLDDLLPIVYDELRRLARAKLRRERAHHTLDSVALVNEAYLKLANQDDLSWENRAHFFGVAARAMRTVLIDYARRRNAVKRGAGEAPVPLDDVLGTLSDAQADHLLALDEALTRLDAVNQDAARVVECRYFAGLTMREAAAALDLSYGTARRRWAFAKAWLKQALADDAPSAA